MTTTEKINTLANAGAFDGRQVAALTSAEQDQQLKSLWAALNAVDVDMPWPVLSVARRRYSDLFDACYYRPGRRVWPSPSQQ